jgi:low affinity Fe/Cu permease
MRVDRRCEASYLQVSGTRLALFASRVTEGKERKMSTILLVILILILLGALPLWPYSSGWGYYPSGGVGLLVLILIILLLTGRL